MRRYAFTLLLLFLPLDALGVSPLAGHPSPYLAMHADDPVHWQLWGEPVLKRAQREHRLIFLSSGYFACHWCHVMQQESFRNAAIAERLNRNFIPVKIDRELWPELDATLIEFVERTRGSAGWPLSVFLTPEGHPLVGTTYLPPERFDDYLRRLQQRWEQDTENLIALAAAAATAPKASAPEEAPIPARALEEALRKALLPAWERDAEKPARCRTGAGGCRFRYPDAGADGR
jgi:hypothetical protein